MKHKPQLVLEDDRDDDYEHSSKKPDKHTKDEMPKRKPHPRAGFAPFGRFGG